MNSFIFGNKVSAKADRLMHNETVKNLWNGFTLKSSVIELSEGDANTFVIGDTDLPELSPTQDFAIKIDEKGIAVKANNYRGLMEGYTTVLGLVEPLCLDDGEESFKISERTEVKEYKLKRRMVHYCVFPETDLQTIRKEIRLAGVLHYTHIVLEFWGMFKYDCLKELSWPNAYSKDTVRAIIREIRELGMEPIPFLNHLGHASMCRAMSGKHTVLDQNPKLQLYFMPNGWDWNIYNPKTVELLKNMRKELVEVFGDCEYFHIGCDEADMITAGDNMSVYLSELTNTVAAEGRKPMLWADMLISKTDINTELTKIDGQNNQYYVACESTEGADKVLKALHPQSILVDWQYGTVEYPLKSFLNLHEKGYNVMEAPWFEHKNCKAAIKTLEAYNGYGLMFTTWNTIRQAYTTAVVTSKSFGRPELLYNQDETYMASVLLRRINFEDVSYSETGLCSGQLSDAI